MGGIMRLRNKRTGEIATLTLSRNGEDMIIMGNDMYAHIAKLSELKDYEDYEEHEEPKEHWCINEFGTPEMAGRFDRENIYDKARKLIGNEFETREEAEQAVEKLKAWKRLKDKGFRFDVMPALGHCDDEKFDISIIAIMPAKWWYNDKVVDDIHYVFGGEE